MGAHDWGAATRRERFINRDAGALAGIRPFDLARTEASLSIIATVRNEAAGIRSFVDSLLAQDLPPDEIVIVDGESTDGTTEILREYERAGKIKLICRSCNIAQGRNIGVLEARNELVAVTDAGCVVDRAWLKNIAQAFASPEQPDVVAGNYDFDARTPFERASVLATDAPDRVRSQLARFQPSSRSVAFKKSAWARVKGYPEWLYAAEDTLFNIRLRQVGCKFRFAENAVVRWRPRQTWKALFRQFFNYARGNGRVGISTPGYVLNIHYHAAVLLFTLAALFWPLAAIAAGLIFAHHVRRNLWDQAARAAGSMMRWRVLAVMEVVRIAGIAGFVAGKLDRWLDASFAANQKAWMGVTTLEETVRVDSAAVGMVALILILAVLTVTRGGLAAAAPALAVTIVLAVRSAINFTRTGPELKTEIQRFYTLYSMLAIGRLAAWAFLLLLVMSGAGILVYQSAAPLLNLPPHDIALASAGLGGIFVVSSLQFLRHLHHIPASIAASFNYRISRLYALWSIVSAERLRRATTLAFGIGLLAALAGIGQAYVEERWPECFALALTLALYLLLAAVAMHRPTPQPKGNTRARHTATPNIVMIGADTLRADRLEATEHVQRLTPFLSSLAATATYLRNCYVPCARTAPSLVSLFSGTWPQKHGVRDNFAVPEDANPDVPRLPQLLQQAGYRTIAVSDWCGADLGKYDLGFEWREVPQDQWNIKYLIRQGPKDIRLFLSLFTHSRFGKLCLPELYYLAGVPMTSELGRTTRQIISEQAQSGQPFLLNVFMSTTHAPFGSESPYYTRFADREYRGESKFVMARLTEPFEIIRRQLDPRSEFDLDQIIKLYDGCVRRFDDEVAAIVQHLERCGLTDNTIVVIYSDHGMEFFENETWGQGNSVIVDESSRIPVVVVDPRQRVGKQVTQITRSIDIAATLLDLIGIAVPPDMDGVSLVPAIKHGADLKLAAYSETGIWFTRLPGISPQHLVYPDLPELLAVADKRKGTLDIKTQYRDLVIRAKDRMLRSGRWKLVYQPMRDGPVYRLYDVASDPLCERDAANERPEVLDALKARLESDWLALERSPASRVP